MRFFFAMLIATCACAHAAQRRTKGAQAAAAERQRLFELPAAILHLQARELMAQGQWEPARARLEAYLAKEPADAAAPFDAGWGEGQPGDPARGAGGDPKAPADRGTPASGAASGFVHGGGGTSSRRASSSRKRPASTRDSLRPG